MQWGNPVPCVGALVEHEGEIILARNRALAEGFFALVTGYLEPLEDPRQAVVVREVREELGLEVRRGAPHRQLHLRAQERGDALLPRGGGRARVKLGAELAEYRRVQARGAEALAARDGARGGGLDARARPPVRVARAPRACSAEHDRT